MPLLITKEGSIPMWTNDTGKRLYLTEDNQVVEEGDARARSLLIGIGGQMLMADAEKYGLAGKGAAAADAKSADAVRAAESAGDADKAAAEKANKLKQAPPANKSK